VHLLTQVQQGTLQAVAAAHLLGLSLRHLRRLLARWRQQGLAALAHGNRGRSSSRRLAEAVRARVLTLARTGGLHR
jgi:transposase